jgi:hypothetical protein
VSAVAIAGNGRSADGRLSVSFVDAGGVPIALVTGPSGERILVDTAPSAGSMTRSIDPLLPALDRRIDLVLLTRRAPTAIGGLPAAVDRYRVRVVAAPGPGAGDATLPAGDATVSLLQSGSSIALSRDARLDIEESPTDRARLSVAAILGNRRIAVTPDARGEAGIRRGPSARPGDDRVALASLPGPGFDLRAAGPVRVSTDGISLWVRPGRGALLPALARGVDAGARPVPESGMLARALPAENAVDPRRRPRPRPASPLPHYPARARLRRRLGPGRIRPHPRALRRDG